MPFQKKRKAPSHYAIYSDVRRQIRDGDIALFRNAGWIRKTGDGPWTHVGKCIWIGETLMLAEVREWFGGRVIDFSSQVEKYPGRIDIHRPKCLPETAARSAELMCRLAGSRYSSQNIFWLAVTRMSLVRLLTGWNPDTTDLTLTALDAPMHCSQATILVDRYSGANQKPEPFFPGPMMGDKWITPDHLGFSSDYPQILEALVPDGWEPDRG